MAFLFKITNSVINQLDEFFDTVDQGILVFEQGVNNYLNNNTESFQENIISIGKLESKADSLFRKIENTLYTKSLLPQFRGDVVRLLEKVDDIIDIAKENLNQFDVEQPNIPESLNLDFSELVSISVKSAEALVISARVFFKDSKAVKDKLHRVFFYEKLADKAANEMKRKVFNQIEGEGLSLSEKQHLRYFALHAENISDSAEVAADILSVMAIKQNL